MRPALFLCIASFSLLLPACALDRAGLLGRDGAVPPRDGGGDPVDSGGRVDGGGDPGDGGGGCTDGATRCAGAMIERCAAGAWQPAEACPGIGGSCQPSGGSGACVRWIPANIPAADINRVFSGGLSELAINSTTVVDTDLCTAFIAGSPVVLGQLGARAGDPELCILRASRIVVNARLNVSGSRVLLLLSEGDIEINALVDAASYRGFIPGPANNTGGNDGSDAATPDRQAGGGGGGGCGSGGDGGHNNSGGPEHPPDYLLAPLRGGSPGGAGRRRRDEVGGDIPGGAGGGALQLSAGGRIVITASGEIDVSGAGGGGGLGDEAGGGGGGSGGALLLESLTGFTLDGPIHLGGGAGGGGSKGSSSSLGTPGEDGFGLLTRRAIGGAGGEGEEARAGGAGGSWESPNGRTGRDDDDTGHGAGGGGGGAGCLGFYSVDGSIPTIGGPAVTRDPGLLRAATSRFE